MRLLILIFIVLTISPIFAQDSEEQAIQELATLHLRTKSVRDSIGKLIKISNQKIKDEKDETNKKELLLAVDSQWTISDKNDIEELKINIEYCKKHPACAYSFGLVNNEVARQSGKNFYNDFEHIYNNASKEIQESERGKSMATKLVLFKQSMVGSLAPKFSGVDIFDQKISLTDFHNEKYVLVDFWASWCAPCREEIPFMNNLREKYKDYGFEIVSISLDENLTQWKNAITNEKIDNWKHFSIKQNSSTVKEDYFVNGIPHKVLIDRNGKIIGKWKASGELNKRELKSQLIQIFGF